MTLIDALLAQGKRAFREPREAAADVLALGVPQTALVPAFTLIVVLNVILNTVSELVAPTLLATVPPLRIAMFVFLLTGALAFFVAKVGQWFGGVGTVPDSLLLIIFFQALFLPLQALHVLLLVASPVLSALLQLVIFVLGIWVNINFVAALHGFPGLGKAAGVLFLASFAVAVVMILVSPILGIQVVGPAPNV